MKTVRSSRPVTMAEAVEALEARFVPEPNTGCWLWIGHVDERLGYGRMVIDGKRRVAHRIAYEALVGPIPDGLQLDHLCRVRCCVNPSHLQPVTQQENIRRGQGIPAMNAAKTHCPKGHAYSSENTYWQPGRLGRRCVLCQKEVRRAYYLNVEKVRRAAHAI